jgi:hypothetical protein
MLIRYTGNQYYFNQIACSTTCKDCSNKQDNCTSCFEQSVLRPLDGDSKTCLRLNCDSACSSCIRDNFCSSCISNNYYLHEISNQIIQCKEKTKVEGTISAISNPKLFELRFSVVWDGLFRDFENNTEISISKLNSSRYKCQIIGEPPSFFVECSFSQNVTSDSVLSLKINNYPKDSITSSHFLVKDYFEIKLMPYIFCGEGEAWRESKFYYCWMKK